MVRAVRYFRVIRAARQKGFVADPKNILANKPLPRGRQNDSLLRHYLFSALFQAWMVGFNQYPKVNNKGYRATKFIIFSDYVLQRLGIGKVEDHFEGFRAYRKKLLINSGFRVVRGKVI